MSRILLAALFALAASPAIAHAHLLTSQPADKAVVTAQPAALTLDFSEGVELRFTGVRLTGPDKAQVALGDGSLDPGDDKKLSVPIKGTLAAGSYTVAWHALATDGHKTNGAFTFTVK
jgi:hypothetical protein